MSPVNDATELLKQFKKQVESRDSNGAKATSTRLKIKMTEFDAQGPAAVKEMALARDFLENSLFFAIQLQARAPCRVVQAVLGRPSGQPDC